MRALVVDDDNELRNLLGYFVDRFGYEVVSAENGQKALEAVRNGDIDLIVTDIKMPEMDGLTMLGKLTELAEDIPVIILTGHGDKDAAIQALKNGAFDFLEKPFPLPSLSASLVKAASWRANKQEREQLIHQLADLKRRDTVNDEDLEAEIQQLSQRIEELKMLRRMNPKASGNA